MYLSIFYIYICVCVFIYREGGGWKERSDPYALWINAMRRHIWKGINIKLISDKLGKEVDYVTEGFMNAHSLLDCNATARSTNALKCAGNTVENGSRERVDGPHHCWQALFSPHIRMHGVSQTYHSTIAARASKMAFRWIRSVSLIRVMQRKGMKHGGEGQERRLDAEELHFH